MCAYICDVALISGWYGNHTDYIYLGANKHRNVFGGLYMLANGISCPLLLTIYDLLFSSLFQMKLSCPFSKVMKVDCVPISSM